MSQNQIAGVQPQQFQQSQNQAMQSQGQQMQGPQQTNMNGGSQQLQQMAPQGMQISGPPGMMQRPSGSGVPGQSSQGGAIMQQIMPNPQMRGHNSYPPQQYPQGHTSYQGQIPPGMYQNVQAGGIMPPYSRQSSHQMNQIPGASGSIPPQPGQPMYNMPPPQQSQAPPGYQQYPPNMQNPNNVIIQQQNQIIKFDQIVQSYVRNFSLEKQKIAGIEVEMQNQSFNYIQKNYDSFLTRATPAEKLNFLENTLLKRKSLINKNSKRYKEIKKQRKENQSNVVRIGRPQLKCPVYGCFKEQPDDQSLLAHYNQHHSDLKALGLDLVLDSGSTGAGRGVGVPSVKGKVHNNLLTQTIIMSILHKPQVKELMQELNEEQPPADL